MGNVTMANLLSTNPSGGGSTSSLVNADGPLGKLRWLRAFGGATPRVFAEGGTSSHMLVAARTAAGIDEVWAWGANTKGQLGIGSTTSFATPVKVAWTPT
ncbi:MAG: Regulator of chromosome condensation repeat, partial [Actinomycetota bacterium]